MLVSNETETISKRTANPKAPDFIVTCATIRCLAYRDSRGKWRDYFNGDELEGEVTIIAEG